MVHIVDIKYLKKLLFLAKEQHTYTEPHLMDCESGSTAGRRLDVNGRLMDEYGFH